nr:CCR4-NOT transcription complex subunit 1-like isoform [Cryptomonas curvata]
MLINMDYINFIFNKICQQQFSLKSIEFSKNHKLKNIVKIAYYLVIKRVCMESNFHKIYDKFTDYISFYFPEFSYVVLKASIEILFLILYKKIKYISFSEIKIIGHLGSWLGRLIIKLSKTRLNKFFVIEKLLLKAYDLNILGIIIPFISGFLYFLSKSKFLFLDNLCTKNSFGLLYEIADLSFLKSNLKINLESLFNYIGISRKLFLNIKKIFRQHSQKKIHLEHKTENFFTDMRKLKEIFFKKKMFAISKYSKLLNQSVTKFSKNFDFRNLLRNELYDEYYIISGTFKKTSLFSEKIFSMRIKYPYILENYIINNEQDFWTAEIKFFEFISNLYIQFYHIIIIMLFNNLSNDDIMYFPAFIWFKKNKKFMISQLSFNFQFIKMLNKKFFQIFVYKNIEIFIIQIGFLKIEKFYNDLKYYTEELDNFKVSTKPVKKYKYFFPFSCTISRIYFFNYCIVIKNDYSIYKSFKNTIFLESLKIFKREFLSLLYLKIYYLSIKKSFLLKIKCYRLFSGKLNYLKIF